MKRRRHKRRKFARVMASRASRMRRKPTKHELLLRKGLQGRGISFDEQRIMGAYIVDFHFAQWKLVVEVDGATHDSAIARIQDARRTVVLKQRPDVDAVLRFTNDEVWGDIKGVLDAIERAGADLVVLP